MKSMKVALVSLLMFLMTALTVAQDAENDAKKLYNEGNALYKQRDYVAAAAKYAEAAKVDPANVTYPLWAGNAYRYGKKYAEAASSYKKAVEVDVPEGLAARILVEHKLNKKKSNDQDTQKDSQG